MSYHAPRARAAPHYLGGGIPRLLDPVLGSTGVYARGGAWAHAPGGLGAVTRSGLTISYYANPSSLHWPDPTIRALHDSFVDVDFTFQGAFRALAQGGAFAVGALNFASTSSGGPAFQQSDLNKLAQLPAPTAGMALLLELCAGLTLTELVKDLLRLQATALVAGSGLFGLSAAALTAAAIAAGVGALGTFGITAVAAVPLGVAAAVCGGVAVGAGITAAILFGIADGKKPSRAEFGAAIKAMARASNKPVPSEGAIDVAYAGLGAGMSAASTSLGVRLQSGADGGGLVPPVAPPRTAVQPGASSSSSTSWVLLGGAAVIAVLIFGR